MPASKSKLAELFQGGLLTDGLSFPSEIDSFNSFIEFRGIDEDGNTTKRPIKLFMPANPKQSNAAEYSTESLVFKNNIDQGGTSFSDVKNALDNLDSGDAMKKIGDVAVDALSVAGWQMIPNGEVLSTVEALTKQTLNPAMTYLFKNMAHRNFSFTFNMIPRNTQESNTIKNIIKELKLIQTPEIKSGGSGRFLKYPDLVQVSYANPQFLHKFKQSVIKNVDVSYNSLGGATWAQYENTAPTGVELTVMFEEITILTRKDVEQGF